MTTSNRLRALALTLVLLGALVGVWGWTGADRASAGEHSASLAELVTALAGFVVELALAWLSLLVGLLALEPASGRRLTGWAGCPDGLRRVLLVCCGVATTAALALPAQAADLPHDPAPSPTPGHAQPHEAAALLDGLPVPDRPSGDAPSGLDRSAAPRERSSPTAATTWPGATTPSRGAGDAATSAAPRAADVTPRTSSRWRASDREPASTTRVTGPAHQSEDSSGTATVRSGDTLWQIASDRLDAGADAGSTSRAWRLIYAANRDLIGPDPDLIRPGTTLRVPPTVQEDQP